MARLGLITDIHGNLEALAAVLAALEVDGVERVLCLGDLVGYNADSDACVGAIVARAIPCIAGNHDLIAVGRLGFERCAARAAFALRRTRHTIGWETRRVLASLPWSWHEGDRLAVHGGLDDPQEYVRSEAAFIRQAERIRARFPGVRVCFFGHTHEPVDRTVAEIRFINPGSVDAARRGDGRAAYAVFDEVSGSLEHHTVPYDAESAEKKARAGGYRMNARARAMANAARRVRAFAAAVGAAMGGR